MTPQQLRELRKEFHRSQSEMAKTFGVSAHTYIRWESNNPPTHSAANRQKFVKLYKFAFGKFPEGYEDYAKFKGGKG